MLLIQVKPFLPFEYTEEGMLQRVSYYVTKQDFCGDFSGANDVWIPRDAISFVAGSAGQSCQDVCWQERRICEPSYFKEINSVEMLRSHMSAECDSVITHDNIFYPAYRLDTGQCVLQKEQLLFSCVGASPAYSRLCPCRTFLKEQSAICQTCL